MTGRRRLAVRAAATVAALAAVTPAWANCLRMNETGDAWPVLEEGRIQGPVTLPEFARFRPFLLAAANQVFTFFRQRNFPAPSLCTLTPIKADILFGDLGAYRSDFGQLEVSLKKSGFVEFAWAADPTGDAAYVEFLDTVAHEVFHAVQHGRAPMDSRPADGSADWIVEGTAVAAGVTYVEAAGLTNPDGLTGWGGYAYDHPLHKPHFALEQDNTRGSFTASPDPLANIAPELDPAYVDAAYATAYRRGHFFYHMGGDLGGTDRIGWLATDYTAAVFDGVGGLRWLDGVLARHAQDGLAAYYPRFIARHAADLGVFSPNARSAAPWTVDLSPGQEARRKGMVQAVAATPVAVDLGLAQDGVYLVEQRLPPDTQGWGRMVVDDQVVPLGESYRRLVGQDRESWLTRVVNVDRAAPWASRGQTFELVISADPVMFDQGCLSPGARFTPALPDRSLALLETAIRADRMRWQIAGGRALAPLTLEAPRRGNGAFDIALLERVPGGWKRHVVGTGVLGAGGCQVRMRAGQSVLTYDPRGDYTEFRETGKPDAMYLGPDGRIALFEAGGWVDLPPEMAAMMQAALASGAGLPGGPAALARGDFEAGPHRLPYELWREFSWPALREATLGGKALVRETTACADGRRGCSTAAFNPVAGALAGATLGNVTVTVTFDPGGMPTQIDFGAEGDADNLRFDTGRFEIRTPPGW